jgi:hypothetical protein
MTWKVGSRRLSGGGGLTTLLKKIQQHGGLDAFKRQWFNLVEKGYASSLVYYFELLL